mgnify:CR=1 FL=1
MNECAHRWQLLQQFGPPVQLCFRCGKDRPFPRHRILPVRKLVGDLHGTTYIACRRCGQGPKAEVHQDE